MDRREFLKRSLAGSWLALEAARELERSWKRSLFLGWSPTLYGDGRHDDTAALQALIDGRRVYSALERRNVQMPDGQIRLHGGVYKVSAAIEITRGNTHISNAHIIQVAQAPVFRIPNPTSHVSIVNGVFQGGSHVWTK